LIKIHPDEWRKLCGENIATTAHDQLAINSSTMLLKYLYSQQQRVAITMASDESSLAKELDLPHRAVPLAYLRYTEDLLLAVLDTDGQGLAIVIDLLLIRSVIRISKPAIYGCWDIWVDEQFLAAELLDMRGYAANMH
jgi:hypothetical protein